MSENESPGVTSSNYLSDSENPKYIQLTLIYQKKKRKKKEKKKAAQSHISKMEPESVQYFFLVNYFQTLKLLLIHFLSLG